MVTPSQTIFRRGACRAFTLVELLVVIGIIIILAALLFPTVDKARKSAYTAPCMSNQKQIVAAMMAYAADNQGQLPDIAQANSSGGETGVWYETLTAYLDFPKNKYAGRHLLRCPAASKKRDDFTYGVNYSTGPDRVFTRRGVGEGNSASYEWNYPGSQRLGNLSPLAILIADAYDPVNPESSVFYKPDSPNWTINTDKDGDGLNDSAGSLGGQRKFNCIEPRHANGKAFVGVAADGSAKLLTIKEWVQNPKYWGPVSGTTPL